MKSLPISATGIFWYRNSRDYQRYLELLEDAHVLPASYSAWRKKAEEVFANELRSGKLAVKAEADPEEFLAWCRVNNHHLDAEGRIAFANLKAMVEARKAGGFNPH